MTCRRRRTFELWTGSGWYSFIPACPPSGHRPECGHSLLETDATLSWTCEATSYNDSRRAYHAHMGWEPYQPMLDAAGRPYPEDEALFEDDPEHQER
jgi:hypothetical protein